MDMSAVIRERNRAWMGKPEIPDWIKKSHRLDGGELDQFFTNTDAAQHYYGQALDYLHRQGLEEGDCLFIEPAAGDGAFFRLMPPDSRLGLDLLPMGEGIIRQDFLAFTPPPTEKRIVLIGNPPFGYRSWLALLFLQKAAQFADYVCFILPMAFQSEGKGSPKKRVKGLRPVYTEVVPPQSFHLPDGREKRINALWQIWERGDGPRPDPRRFSAYLELFTVDSRKERLCGQKKAEQADFFLQRTYYRQPPHLVKEFSQVRYTCGYGLILKKEREQIIRILNTTDWDHFSNLAAHNCRHISMYHILMALEAGGLCPELPVPPPKSRGRRPPPRREG